MLGLLDHHTVCTPNNRSTLLYLLLIMYTHIYMRACMYTHVHIHLDTRIHAYTHIKIKYAYASMYIYTYFSSPNWYQFKEKKHTYKKSDAKPTAQTSCGPSWVQRTITSRDKGWVMVLVIKSSQTGQAERDLIICPSLGR